MKKKSQSSPVMRYVSALLILSFTIACFGGMSVVWLQQQIQEISRDTARLEADLHDLQRRNSSAAGRIARAEQPGLLIQRTSGSMRPTMEGQLVRARPRVSQEAIAVTGVAEPHEARLDLAFLNASASAGFRE